MNFDPEPYGIRSKHWKNVPKDIKDNLMAICEVTPTEDGVTIKCPVASDLNDLRKWIRGNVYFKRGLLPNDGSESA